MKINSRTKGSSFERQLAAELFSLTGVSFKRNLEQVRTVDHSDLTPDDPSWPFSLEAKRYASGNGCKPAWREQATRAAKLIGKIPCVVFKYDRLPIVASMPIEAINPAMTGTGFWVDMSLETLAMLAGEIMAKEAA